MNKEWLKTIVLVVLLIGSIVYLVLSYQSQIKL